MAGEAVEVVGEFPNSRITMIGILLQTLHDDPVEIAADFSHQRRKLGASLPCAFLRPVPEVGQSGRRLGRIMLPNQPVKLVQSGAAQCFRINRQRTHEQLVEQNAE